MWFWLLQFLIFAYFLLLAENVATSELWFCDPKTGMKEVFTQYIKIGKGVHLEWYPFSCREIYIRVYLSVYFSTLSAFIMNMVGRVYGVLRPQ